VEESVVAGEVLGAMITPAVLISASGLLVLSTSNRLSRAVDRVRVLSSEAESWHGPSDTETAKRRQILVAGQVEQLSQRAVLLRSALTALYASIGFLVATSIGVGVAALFEWRYGWVAVGLGLAGACSLFYGSLLLIREAQLAVRSTLEELAFVRDVVRSVRNGEHKT
jgi:hypothetical protein